MRVLVWHVHGSWSTSFLSGTHEYLVPVVPGRGPDGRGRASTWDWPPSVVERTPTELRALAAEGGIDVVVLQRPHELDLLTRWTGLEAGKDVPAVYLEHNTPSGPAATTRHPCAEVDQVARGQVPLVHVTAFNELMWDCGTARTLVIDHGVADPGHLYTGTEAHVGAVVNDPVRRWRVVGTDVLLRVAGSVPVQIYGINVAGLADHLDEAPGTVLHEDVPQAQMHRKLAAARAYLHPFRWTSLGLSLLEAMALGLPVVALGTTETPVAVPAAAGVVSNRPDDLVAAARRWLADPDEAKAHGDAARAHVLARYPLAEFLLRWDTTLHEVTS
jgi:hypothetical protein